MVPRKKAKIMITDAMKSDAVIQDEFTGACVAPLVYLTQVTEHLGLSGDHPGHGEVLGQGRDGIVVQCDDMTILKFTVSQEEAAVIASMAERPECAAWRLVGPVEIQTYGEGTGRGPRLWAFARADLADITWDVEDEDAIDAYLEGHEFELPKRQRTKIYKAMADEDQDVVDEIVAQTTMLQKLLGIDVRDLQCQNIGKTLDGQILIRDFSRCDVPDQILASALGRITVVPAMDENAAMCAYA